MVTLKEAVWLVVHHFTWTAHGALDAVCGGLAPISAGDQEFCQSWPTLAKTDFGQTDFGQPSLAKLWRLYLWLVSECVCVLCVVCGVCVCVLGVGGFGAARAPHDSPRTPNVHI